MCVCACVNMCVWVGVCVSMLKCGLYLTWLKGFVCVLLLCQSSCFCSNFTIMDCCAVHTPGYSGVSTVKPLQHWLDWVKI